MRREVFSPRVKADWKREGSGAPSQGSPEGSLCSGGGQEGTASEIKEGGGRAGLEKGVPGARLGEGGGINTQSELCGHLAASGTIQGGSWQARPWGQPRRPDQNPCEGRGADCGSFWRLSVTLTCTRV